MKGIRWRLNFQALLAAVSGQKSAFFLPGAGHNNFAEIGGARYGEVLREFAAMCARAQGVTL